jgi:hypothetical protein
MGRDDAEIQIIGGEPRGRERFMFTGFEIGPSGYPSDEMKELKKIIAARHPNDDYINGRFMIIAQHYDRLSFKDGKNYSFAQLVLAVSSGLTPFLIGLQAIWMPTSIWLKIFSLVTSLFAAILVTYLSVFGFQQKWVAYRSIRESLLAEFYRYDKCLDPYSPGKDSNEMARLFYTRVEDLIADANETWGSLHQTKQ